MRDTGRLSFVEKAGYSLGDAAANFVFMTMILFQLNFYTDTMGITAAAAGTMLLVGRLWDAFFDPMMGVLADRTNTRWGKFRPWVLWTALPWGVVMVLAYTTPGFGSAGTLFYAFLTNVLLMTLYSANNTPYSAMSGVMTGDVNERTRLSSYRFVAAMLAQLIVGGFTLPLVAKFGQGDNAKGWQTTMGLWAIVCVACFVITFATTRERIQPDPKQKSSPKDDFAALLANGPWIAMFVLTLAHFVFVAMRGGTMFYYFNYYVSPDRLATFLDGVGLGASSGTETGTGHYLLGILGLVVNADRSNVASVGFSLFNISSQAVTVLGVIASAGLAVRFGKRAVALVGFTCATILMAAFIALPADAIGTTYLLELARALAYAPTIPLIWAMFADVADYAEWKTGRRTTGVIFATILFALKAGLSLGGAIAGWLLAAYGYRANAVQTPDALRGIRLTISVYPALFLAVVVVCLLRYKITKALNIQIQDELAERRRSFATVAVIAAATVVSACAPSASPSTAPAPARAAVAPDKTTLRGAFDGSFLVGAALNDAQFSGRDTVGVATITRQFNTITPENVLKWQLVHPQPGIYDFAAPDRYVAFGERHGMFIVGHTLIWHNQTPAWVFQDASGARVSRDTLLARMRDHIHTVVGRYKGRIKGWDVINEALNEDGTLRRTPWLEIIGEDYLVKAYQFAREADPAVELYYNDYSVENAPKRNGAVALITRLQAAGIRVAAIGLQGHNRLEWPSVAQQDSTIAAFAALGIKVMITELDVDVLPRATGGGPTADVTASAERQARLDPYKAGLPDSVQQALAQRYADLFGVYLKHRDAISRVTFWGVADGDSWLNDWPVRGRTSYPLLFGRDGRPKPAFEAVLRAAGLLPASNDE